MLSALSRDADFDSGIGSFAGVAAAALAEIVLAFCSIDTFSFSGELFVGGVFANSEIDLPLDDGLGRVGASAVGFCAEASVCAGKDFRTLEKFDPAPAVIAASRSGFDPDGEFSLEVVASASLPVCMGCDATKAENNVLLGIFTGLSVGRLGSWVIADVGFCEEGFPLLFPLSFVPVVLRPLFPDLLLTLGVDDVFWASCVACDNAAENCPVGAGLDTGAGTGLGLTAIWGMLTFTVFLNR